MNRLLGTICVLAFAVVLSCTLGLSTAGDKGKKEPTIQDLMLQSHKGKDSPLAKVDEQLRADAPSWDEIQKNARPLVDLGKRLEGYSDRYTSGKAYAGSAKALGTAVEKRDMEAAVKAFKSLKSTCASCHRDKMPDLK